MAADTQDLLEQYLREGSEPAFRELVTRYLDLVFSTAVRLVEGDTHKAEDVSQVVFSDLAKMAGKIAGGVQLGGWLHRHTCYVARTMMRGERRRVARERQAAEMNALEKEGGLSMVASVLDEAIQELGPDDREAILLRFFERMNLRLVGEALGVNENVAQKRVSRAVRELGLILERRGVSVSIAVLTVGLASEAVKAAPVGIAAAIAGKALIAPGQAGASALTITKRAVTGKLKIAFAGLVVTGGLVLVMFQSRRGPPAEDGTISAQGPVAVFQAPSKSFSAPQVAGAPGVTPGPQATLTSKSEEPTSKTAINPTQSIKAAPAETLIPATGVPLQRLGPLPGSKLRIEGRSNNGKWRAEGSLIGGFLEVPARFPEFPAQDPQSQVLQGRTEAFVPVASLRSVDETGKPFSDKMDEMMHAALKSGTHPRIRYSLDQLSFKGARDASGRVGYEFESRGSLALAGVTNAISMSVTFVPLGAERFEVAGRTSLSMSSFRIRPPEFLSFKVENEVTVSFEWVVGIRNNAQRDSATNLVPLRLDLPEPGFRGWPRDLRLDENTELPRDTPRPPLLVPPGLVNLATTSLITSSDKNVGPEVLTRIVDGDKSATDKSVVFLRKGVQWVQMDLAHPCEIYGVVIWHAHNSAKVYHSVIIQMAADPDFMDEARVVFNNDRNNASGLGAGKDREYVETYEGKLINVRGANARFIRFYSNGSTESALNEYTEIEVYGRPVP